MADDTQGMVTFSVQLDPEIDDALTAIKETTGIPKAAYIRFAVLERLEREGHTPRKPKPKRA